MLTVRIHDSSGGIFEVRGKVRTLTIYSLGIHKAVGRMLILLVCLLALYLKCCESSSGPVELRSLAVCITGQLLRLELGSKIENFVKVNLDRGHHIDLYILLDNQLDKHKAVKRAGRYSADSCLFKNTTAGNMEQLIYSQIPIKYTNTSLPKFSCRVRLEQPGRSNFPLTGLNPVCPIHSSCGEKERSSEAAKSRFQNHMRWQSGVRECVKWVQEEEYNKRHFYDYVMRMREDTFVFAPFIVYTSSYVNSIVVLDMNGFHGLNDHNMIVDRKFADVLFRGLVEDYYFQEGNFSSHEFESSYWGNPERLLLRISSFYSVKVVKKSICLFPTAPISSRLVGTRGNDAIIAYSMGAMFKKRKVGSGVYKVDESGISIIDMFKRKRCASRGKLPKLFRSDTDLNIELREMDGVYWHVYPIGLESLIIDYGVEAIMKMNKDV